MIDVIARPKMVEVKVNQGITARSVWLTPEQVDELIAKLKVALKDVRG